jgi:hypothetical protein
MVPDTMINSQLHNRFHNFIFLNSQSLVHVLCDDSKELVYVCPCSKETIH